MAWSEPELLAAIQASLPDLLALCRELVAAPSVNPPGDTRAVAEVVRAYLRSVGLAHEVLADDPAMPNVVASVSGTRPGPHLVLNAHMDTMPPGDVSAWTVPVNEVTERDGRLYGLGMGNMKGALAGMLTAVGVLARAPDRLAGTVTLTAVSDEVVFGPAGAAHLLQRRPALYGDALISGEGPGFGRLAVAEKGVCWVELSVTAAGGHSSAVNPGESASAQLARAVLVVDALTGRRATVPPELAVALPETGPGDRGRLLTSNVGTLQAGSFVGQIATSGTAGVDLRLPPGAAMREVEAEISRLAGPDVTVRRIKDWDANWTPPEHPFVQLVQGAITSVRGRRAELAIRLPASDASRWRERGVPAVCYGPQPTLSAGIDDYATLSDLMGCAAVYALAAARFLGGDDR